MLNYLYFTLYDNTGSECSTKKVLQLQACLQLHTNLANWNAYLIVQILVAKHLLRKYNKNSLQMYFASDLIITVFEYFYQDNIKQYLVFGNGSIFLLK